MTVASYARCKLPDLPVRAAGTNERFRATRRPGASSARSSNIGATPTRKISTSNGRTWDGTGGLRFSSVNVVIKPAEGRRESPESKDMLSAVTQSGIA